MTQNGARDAGGETGARAEPPAEILAPAPILAFLAFAIGLGVDRVVPRRVLPRPWHLVVGGVFLAAGLVVLLGALRAMQRAGTSPAHDDEPPELLTTGPFRYSRNPIYLGVCLVYVSLALVLNALWAFGPLVVLVWYFDRVARREEVYLEARFGEEYARYRDRVRRWL